MKSRWIAIVTICVLAISADAQTNSGAQPAVGPIANLAGQAANGAGNAPMKLGTGQEPVSYPERLEAVLATMSAELSEIGQAAHEGKITNAQAQYLTLERYYVALTRFQLLRAMYAAPPEGDPAQSYSQPNAPAQVSADTLSIPPIACSSDIPEQLVVYLELTPVETQALETQVTEECKQVQPLIEKLDNSRRKLLAMKLDGKADDRAVQTMAAEQSQIMKQLIVMNSQLETKLYTMLTTEQQRKVEALLRQTLKPQHKPPVAE